jgi:hypothetical protein
MEGLATKDVRIRTNLSGIEHTSAPTSWSQQIVESENRNGTAGHPMAY